MNELYHQASKKQNTNYQLIIIKQQKSKVVARSISNKKEGTNVQYKVSITKNSGAVVQQCNSGISQQHEGLYPNPGLRSVASIFSTCYGHLKIPLNIDFWISYHSHLPSNSKIQPITCFCLNQPRNTQKQTLHKAEKSINEQKN